jgi:hypothetical protein
MGIRAQRSGVGAGRHLLAEPRFFIRAADQRQEWTADLGRLLQQVTRALPELRRTRRKSPTWSSDFIQPMRLRSMQNCSS